MGTGRAIKNTSLFQMVCSVSIDIRAQPQRIWHLLTDAADIARWNTTVTSITGRIERGGKIAIKVPAAPGRTFKPTVSEFEPDRKMTWSDGFSPIFKGVRTFELTPQSDGATRFQLSETFSGLFLPMIKGSLPDFAPVFEQYAADLKREAERSAA